MTHKNYLDLVVGAADLIAADNPSLARVDDIIEWAAERIVKDMGGNEYAINRVVRDIENELGL